MSAASPPDRIRSADGTMLAFERAGGGPSLVVVGGALSDRSTFRGLARRLSDAATVVCYDRRGRGDSGDRLPHRVADEVDDLHALCAHTGPPAVLYGHSSGGLLALAAIARGLPVGRLVVYEPPFLTGALARRVGPGLGARLGRLALEDRRAEAISAFLVRGMGMSPEEVVALQGAPAWGAMLGLAHTLAYDVALSVGDEAVGASEAAAVEVESLVLAGGDSRGTIREAAEDRAGRLPKGRLEVLGGQGHVVESAAVAPVLAAELGEGARRC